MNADDVGGFLSRWSRRKLGKAEPAPVQEAPLPPAAAGEQTAEPAKPLPPVETLTPESDFTPFMRPEVDVGVKQAALKTLFRDPHFNKMDGLDTYIDDYTLADPIPDEMMKKLYQAREHLFSPEEKAAAVAEEAAQESAKPEVLAPEANAEAGPAADSPTPTKA